MTDQPNDIASAIEAGRALGQLSVIDIDGIPASVLNENARVELHEELLPAPRRVKAGVVTTDARSFLEYFNRYADDNSAIFCVTDTGEFIGIIDYHAEDKAAWAEHRVYFCVTETEEWKTWFLFSGKKMSQEDFGLFIESNLDEIVDPPGAEMLEIALSLRAKNKVAFASATRLDNGQVQLTYQEEIEGRAGVKGQLAIPEKIKLGMRIAEGGEAFAIEARFRYRITDGHLSMWYDLIRPHKAHRAAIDDAIAVIKEQAKCQLMINGRPG